MLAARTTDRRPTAHPCERSGAIDNTVERRLAPLTAAEEENPPRSKVRTPLYEAKVDPDIYFFGFDLTADEAKGGTGEQPDDDPGWFFVIKERPGEPRFGLDIEQAAGRSTSGTTCRGRTCSRSRPAAFIEITRRAATIPLVAPTGRGRQEKLDAAPGRHARRLERTHERGRRWPTSSSRRRCWSPCTPAEMLPQKKD